MIIGLPKEIKDNEYRVGLTPAGVRALKDAGHEIRVEVNAGAGSGFEDSLYERAGATLVESADNVWASAEMIVKVKEPIAPEYPRMREGQLLFTYLHLAPDRELTKELLDRKVTGIAYETITDRRGTLPLLTPMSEVAGRMAIQVGAHYLEKMSGGRGILLGGVPGVPALDDRVSGMLAGLGAIKGKIKIVSKLETDCDQTKGAHAAQTMLTQQLQTLYELTNDPQPGMFDAIAAAALLDDRFGDRALRQFAIGDDGLALQPAGDLNIEVITGLDLGHFAILFRAQQVFHLHGLDDRQFLTGLDLLPHFDRDAGEHVKIDRASKTAPNFSVEVTFSSPGFSIILEN